MAGEKGKEGEKNIFPGFIQEGVPDWLNKIYHDYAERAQNLTAEKTQRKKFPGDRLARLPADVKHAQALSRKTGAYAPNLKSSEDLLKSAQRTFPQRANEYMDPFEKTVIRDIADEGSRVFNEGILPSLESQFVRLGQHGSSTHANLAKHAAKDIQKAIMAEQNKVRHQGYQQSAHIHSADMARQLEAAREMATVGGLKQAGNLADIAALTEMGQLEQAQEQKQKQISYEDFLRQEAEEYLKLSEQMGLMSGVPRPINQSTFAPGAIPEAQLNTTGQLANLAGNIWGASQQGQHHLGDPWVSQHGTKAQGHHHRARGGYIRGR